MNVRSEHRLFSHITMNWRGRPLTSHQTVVNLIANTKTRTGLKIRAEQDKHSYPTGIKITKTELKALPITGHDFHPEWNYTITPPTTTQTIPLRRVVGSSCHTPGS